MWWDNWSLSLSLFAPFASPGEAESSTACRTISCSDLDRLLLCLPCDPTFLLAHVAFQALPLSDRNHVSLLLLMYYGSNIRFLDQGSGCGGFRTRPRPSCSEFLLFSSFNITFSCLPFIDFPQVWKLTCSIVYSSFLNVISCASIQVCLKTGWWEHRYWNTLHSSGDQNTKSPTLSFSRIFFS